MLQWYPRLVLLLVFALLLASLLAAAPRLLFGWDVGVLVAAVAPAFMQLLEHRPPIRIAYNGAMYAVTAISAGWAIDMVHGSGVGPLLARTIVCALVFQGLNTV